MRHIIPISGKDSCATAIVQLVRRPDLPYELFFNDVGAELPETYAWLDKVEAVLKRPVHRVGESLERIILNKGMLPSPHMRFCTKEAKIDPMEEFVGRDEAMIYFGIRADEDRVGYIPSRHNIVPVYPLKEIGIDLKAVYGVLDKFDLCPPQFFWQSVYDQVFRKMDRDYQRGFKVFQSAQQVLDQLPRWMFDRLFAWRTRSNCYFCFFQNVWEWCGLLEYHPDLFTRAEEIEIRVGGEGVERRSGKEKETRQDDFTWIRGRSLSSLRKDREKIKQRRVVRIVKILRTTRIDFSESDLLAVTSCGLFCGK